MTAPGSLGLRIEGRSLVVSCHDAEVRLHPLWLRERDCSASAIDQTNGQRLIEPIDIPLDVAATAVSERDGRIYVEFSDGHVAELYPHHLLVDAGLRIDSQALPHAALWTGAPANPVSIEWANLTGNCARDGLSEALAGFFTDGFFIIRRAPRAPNSLPSITAPFGRIWGTFFGDLFDVRSVPQAVDLAYTSIALSAHTDQPYGQPVPQIQLLHAIDNEAEGGDSLLVDGLAVASQLRIADPEAYRALSEVQSEYRYDCGPNTARAKSPLLEHHDDGSLASVRFSPRLDFAPVASERQLDDYYRGRRWLADQLNRPENAYQFRLKAGDVLVMDNRRLLHGRTAFVAASGPRHFQGGYLPYDGLIAAWRRLRIEGTQPPTED